MKLLQQASRQTTWSIQFAYRLAQEFQQLLRAVREEVKLETDEALKREQTRYKDATDGAWLEEREEYYKALTESLYLQRRAALVETLFALVDRRSSREQCRCTKGHCQSQNRKLLRSRVALPLPKF